MAISYKTTTSEKKIKGRTYSTINSTRTDDVDGSTVTIRVSGYIDTKEEKDAFKLAIEAEFKRKKALQDANDSVVDGLGDKISAFMLTKEPL